MRLNRMGATTLIGSTRNRPADRRRRIAVVALLVGVALAGIGPTPAPARAAELREGCRGPADSVAIADDLLRNRYTLGAHPTVVLPTNPTWSEDPLRSKNWQFNLHSLRFVLALTSAWDETGDTRYRDRAVFLLSDWYRDNPRVNPPSIWSWDEHATAWRATVYVCAAEMLPRWSWLGDALLLHGRTLASSSVYRGEGNHALNQNIGLLEVGCFLGRSDWTSLAARRTGVLVTESLDQAGATNEQSVYYELYNYGRYRYARTRLMECAVAVPSTLARIDKMPTFLAHATMPDGRYVPLGDTVPNEATAIGGTEAEFAATRGASGPRPTTTWRVYAAGFAFARTGWGEERPYADEVLLTARFGPARRFHGHVDDTSITLYGYGRQLLLDSGQYSIDPSPYRAFFVSREAHNLVTVAGLTPATTGTSLRWARSSPAMFEVAMASRPYAAVSAERRVTFSRQLGYVVVDDRLAATSSRTFRQLWHLREGTSPVVQGTRAWTRADRGNVMVIQLAARPTIRIVTGSTSPIQGWVSYRAGRRVAAPVVESRRSGTSARFLTLLVPYASRRPVVSVTGLSLVSGGYRMVVTIDGHAERVSAGSTTTSITPLP